MRLVRKWSVGAGAVMLIGMGIGAFHPGTSSLAAQEDTALVLAPLQAFDPMLEPLKVHLRLNARVSLESSVALTDSLLGPFGGDAGAWEQASGYLRAALWFSLGRQALLAQDDAMTLRAFDQTRRILEESGLLVRGPLLSSIALLSGRIHFLRGELSQADEAFRTAALVDPNDLSSYLPEPEVKSRYAALRQEVAEASRRSLKVEVSGDGREGAALFINGTSVSSQGPTWIVELPPGRHHVAAFRPGYRADSAGVTLRTEGERPEVLLRLEPGKAAELVQRPFALADVSELLRRLQELADRAGAPRVLVEVVIGSLEGAVERGGTPRVGVQTGVRVNPGPDSGERSEAVAPLKVELFEISRQGVVRYLGGSVVNPA